MPRIKHICVRYFIVPLEANLFTRPASHKKKMEWFREAFFSNLDFKTKSEAEYAVRIVKDEANLVYGKISKKAMYHLHDKTPKDIRDKSIEDWPYVGFVCNMEESKQIMVIEYDSSIYYKTGRFLEVLAELANQKMFNYGYAVAFEPVVDEMGFWNIIDSVEGVYSLKFYFNSPNIFGASSSANEALKEIQKIYNNNKLEITLINDNANLNIPKGIDTYREYADKGGGHWKITAKQKNIKKNYNSTEKVIKIEIEGDERANPETLAKALADFIRRLGQ